MRQNGAAPASVARSLAIDVAQRPAWRDVVAHQALERLAVRKSAIANPTTYIDNLATATAAIEEVKALGIHIALDDFGTGFSSLSLLRALPFTRIKIDRSFIQDMATSPQSSAIVEAVCGLCGNLGVQVTAEGVETADAARRLRAKGCTDLQGYAFGKPMAASSVGAWIEARRSDGAIRIPPNGARVERNTV